MKAEELKVICDAVTELTKIRTRDAPGHFAVENFASELFEMMLKAYINFGAPEYGAAPKSWTMEGWFAEPAGGVVKLQTVKYRYFWVIERVGVLIGPQYWFPNGPEGPGWVADIHNTVHFEREADAQRIVNWLLLNNVRIAQHSEAIPS
jgi:hypothetical protein